MAQAAATTQTATSSMSSAVSKFGGLSTLAIGVAATAVVAFAASSVKAAIDYDKAFTRIAAISNASAKDIEKWKGEVLDLAGDTARAPKELADALFFLSSAGLDTGDVMKALKQSAMAAASGLGSTVDVAKITANAMNAYADAGLTATQVTDTLVAAVREGSAEPEEFAAALGRILPIASKAEIEFGEVTASLAALSNIGLDVNEGVTAMRGLLTALFAPTEQTSKALDTLGLTADDVRTALSEGGLISALRMLEERSGGNIDVMRQLVPNVRALTGVFGLTTQEATKVDAQFKNIINSTGSLDKAFKETSEGSAFKMEKALNDLKIAGLELAEVFLPLISVLATTVSAMTQVDEVVLRSQRFTEGYGDTLRALKDDLDAGQISAEEFRAGVLAATEAERSGAQASDIAAKATAGVTQSLEKVTGALHEATDAAREQRLAILSLSNNFLGIVDSANQVAEAQRKLNELERKGKEDTKAYEDAVIAAIEAQFGLEDAVISYGKELVDAGEKQGAVIDKIKETAKQFGIQKGDVGDLIGKIRDYINALGDIPSQVQTTVSATQVGGHPVPLQHGGIVRHPTLALVGEAGPEAVVPLGSGMLGGFTGDIVLQLDGQVLARITRDQLLKLKARNATTGL